MQLGILGDLHLTNRKPERRLDDYFKTQMDKLEQAFVIFREHRCDHIIQVGDFYDSPTVADRVKSVMIKFLREKKEKIFCVWGQHDVTGHSVSTLPNSPIAVLQAADVVKIVDEQWYTLGMKDTKYVVIYGASFGEEIPKPSDIESTYNILVIHKMIGNKPLYPGQDLIDPKRFLKKYPEYNLVLAGDYHYRFVEQVDHRVIINPGAIVRKTISENDLEHRPAVVVFDTDTQSTEIIELNVKPIEEIFNFARTEKKDSAILLQFIQRLNNQSKEDIGWKHLLIQILKEKYASDEVKRIIDECLEGIKDE